MSSPNWLYNTRRFGFNVNARLNALIAKFNEKITDDISDEGGEELQTRSEGGVGRSYLKVCDDKLVRLDNTITADIVAATQSCPTYEPDGHDCRLLINFDNTGGLIPDYSGFNHHARGYGVSRMQFGIRYGYGTLSLEVVFDGRTNFAVVSDHFDLDFASTDFSIQFRFSPFDLTMARFHKQVIISKKDKHGNWYVFQLTEDGKAMFMMERFDRYYCISTPANTITATSYADTTPDSQRYDAAVTFDFISGTLLLYINNTKYTTVTTTIPDDASIPDYDGTDLMIGRYTALQGKPVTLPPIDDVDPIRLFSKLYFGTLQQLKYWKRVLTDAEISQHYDNKVTISNVTFGNVAIPGGLFVPT